MRGKNRVVITGIGMLSPLGIGGEENWRKIKNGDSSDGVNVPNFVPQDFIKKRKLIKLMNREAQLACAGAVLAFEDAGIEASLFPSERMGMFIGTGLTSGELQDIVLLLENSLDKNNNLSFSLLGEKAIPQCDPLISFRILPNMPLCYISILLQIKGPNMVFNPWAGNNAQGIGEAFRAIQNGELDCALVGGADSKAHYVGFVTFSQHNLLSKKGICCPFDENRDGLILSEGSCFLVLEKLEIAQKRDAKIYAEIIGYGEATDWESQGFFSENVQILEKAMKNALNDANIEPYQVDYINASANSHPIGDFTEGKAIMNLFNNKPVVNSTKALTNELGAASASFELAVCAMAIKNKTIPPTVNLNTPDKRLRLNFGSKETQREEINIGLTNSFELGSSKVTLILRKYL